jgi:hypothetical protein
MMKRLKIIRIFGILSLLFLFGFVFFSIILPFIILPPYPAELFYILNKDDMNHTVEVEILNSKGNSIYLKSFNISPDSRIEIDRGFDWCPKNRFYFLNWDEGSYTFYVSLDDVYNKSHYINLYPRVSIYISIDNDSYNPLMISRLYSD